jgi:serine/threonine protein kinase
VQITSTLNSFLEGLHRSGRVHRNINPDNAVCMPGRNWEWGLREWGNSEIEAEIAALPPLTYFTDPQTASASLKGKQFEVADPACDIWALGVLMFTLLCQCSPFPKNARPSEVRHIPSKPMCPLRHSNSSKYKANNYCKYNRLSTESSSM